MVVGTDPALDDDMADGVQEENKSGGLGSFGEWICYVR